MNKRYTIYNNREAYFNFEIEKSFTAGIILQGGEIKSIRLGETSIKEGYCYFEEDGLYIKNMYIKPFAKKGQQVKEVEPRRNRKLLLNKDELKKLKAGVEQKGYSIVPVTLFIDKGLAKLEIALAKGKKLYDKRESIKARDQERDKSRQ